MSVRSTHSWHKDFAHPVQVKELSHAIRQTKLGMTQLEQGLILLCKQMELLLDLETSFEPKALPENIGPARNLFRVQSYTSHCHTSIPSRSSRCKAAMGDLVPTVALMGATTATQGQGPFTPTSQQYLDLAFKDNWLLGTKMDDLQTAPNGCHHGGTRT